MKTKSYTAVWAKRSISPTARRVHKAPIKTLKHLGATPAPQPVRFDTPTERKAKANLALKKVRSARRTTAKLKKANSK